MAGGFAARWVGLAALLLLAACGGERRESAAAGTEGTAAGDTAAALPSDTAAATAPDTAPDTAQPSGGTAAAARDTTTAKQAQRPPAAAPKPAPPKPKPARPTRDTTTMAQDTATPQSTATAQDAGTAAAGGTPPGETQTATAPLRDEYHQAPKDTVDQATYDGWKQYNLNCARCHGEDVLGTTIAPHLIVSLKPEGPINTQEAFVQVVCAGRPEKGMPAWCSLGMDPAKINQIYSYVKGRSEGKIGPGRPARKEG
jgi:hypothetical protein